MIAVKWSFLFKISILAQSNKTRLDEESVVQVKNFVAAACDPEEGEIFIKGEKAFLTN